MVWICINSKILDISGINFVDFPLSIKDLKNLVTLHLEYCDIKYGFASTIGNLAKLEVLEVSKCESLLLIFLMSEIYGADSSVRVAMFEEIGAQWLEEASVTRDNMIHHLLFNEKIKCHSIKEMHLIGLDQIDKACDFRGP